MSAELGYPWHRRVSIGWVWDRGRRGGVGSKLRTRARALGLSETEVTRRLDMGPSRYTNYVNDVRGPDCDTFLRICRVTGTS